MAGGIDEASLGELEEKLLAADFGVPATMRLTDRAEQSLRRGESRGADGLGETLKSEIAEILQPATDAHLNAAESGLTVYLIVGVNGVGKTTTVAKARRLPRAGRAERDGCSGRHLPGRSGRAARGVGGPDRCRLPAGAAGRRPRRPWRSTRWTPPRPGGRRSSSSTLRGGCTRTAASWRSSPRSTAWCGAGSRAHRTRHSWCSTPRSARTQ